MVSAHLVGAVQILTGAGSLAFLKPAWENRGKPGSTSFGVFAVAVAAYALATGVNLLTGNGAASFALAQVVVSSGVLTGVAWLFLALEVTRPAAVNRRVVGSVAAYLLMAWLVTWINPGSIVIGDGHELIGTQFDPDYGVGFWILLGGAYAQVLLGTWLLGAESVRSTGIRRRQTGLLASAIVPTFVMSVFNAAMLTGGGPTYDYTVFGWGMTLLTFAVALYSGRFLDISAIARRAAMGEMRDAMITLDDQNRVVDCNAAARALFDVDGEYVGMSPEAFFDPIPADDLSEVLAGATTETPVTGRFGGETRYFSVSSTPVSDAVGRGRVLVFHDVTAQKRREAELERQNERLDEFASMVSHDLRNPLSIARGYTDRAEETGDPEDFDTLRTAHDRMEAMIDDLLALARAGRAVEEAEPVALAEVTREAWATVDTGGSEVDVRVPEGTAVRADGTRLRRVFENCFRNAVEHNESPVTVRVGTLTRADNGTQPAGVFVEDDGRGISGSERDTVFDHGYTTSDDGTGLGLSIVEDVVDAHGWRIRVTDGADGGARFEITGVEFVTS